MILRLDRDLSAFGPCVVEVEVERVVGSDGCGYGATIRRAVQKETGRIIRWDEIGAAERRRIEDVACDEAEATSPRDPRDRGLTGALALLLLLVPYALFAVMR